MYLIDNNVSCYVVDLTQYLRVDTQSTENTCDWLSVSIGLECPPCSFEVLGWGIPFLDMGVLDEFSNSFP